MFWCVSNDQLKMGLNTIPIKHIYNIHILFVNASSLVNRVKENELHVKYQYIVYVQSMTYSLSRKTVNGRENFWNVYCSVTNQMRDETARDNPQTAE